jgi:hypothetical protein
MNVTNQEEMERLLSLDINELYPMLIAGDDSTVYSKMGSVVRGKEIFLQILPGIKEKICVPYISRTSRAKSLIDLVVLVATAISGAIEVKNIPLIPLASIIVKLGLDEICQDYKRINK